MRNAVSVTIATLGVYVYAYSAGNNELPGTLIGVAITGWALLRK